MARHRADRAVDALPALDPVTDPATDPSDPTQTGTFPAIRQARNQARDRTRERMPAVPGGREGSSPIRADKTSVRLPAVRPGTHRPPAAPAPAPAPDVEIGDADGGYAPVEPGGPGEPSLATSSAVMAAGTVVSRMSGFVRSALLAAALGTFLHADVFTIANTVPNMLYILLAGGVFNAVLVPQLVRAMRDDDDRGEAYTNRVISVAALFLAAVTVLLVVLAPQLMSLYLTDRYDEPDRAAHLASVVNLARFCLPQVFFYGMFVLVGQVLNARGRFGPMMWAPIANNVISVGVLVVYLVAFGPARGPERFAAFTPGQETLLGLGSTAGIAAQLLILLPYLRRAGFRFRPRLDLRGSGLGHTARLGVWTVLFVIVNQAAYTVVVRLASSGTADGQRGTGYLVYSATFLIVMVPHSVITVSLATAVLPRLSRRAAGGDLYGLGDELGTTLRSVLLVVVPFAALLPLVASDLSHVIWGYGSASNSYQSFAPSLALFGPGLVAFTVHYLVLRGFYALELTRTVFYVQCVVAAVNVAVALTLVRDADPADVAPMLVLAYLASYGVGAVVSYGVLRRRVGGLGTARTVRFTLQLLVTTALATGVAALAARALSGLGQDPSLGLALLRGGVVGLVGVLGVVLVARVVGPSELTSALGAGGRFVRRRWGRA